MFVRAALVLLVFAGGSGAAQGAFVVTTSNVTVNAGGDPVRLDVSISGPERLDWFSLELILTQTGGPPGSVRFLIDDDTGLPPLPPFTHADYVFKDNSELYGSGNPAAVTPAGDTYTFSDATLDFAGADVSGGKLLTQVWIKIDGAAAGSNYQLSIGTGSFFRDEFFYVTDTPIDYKPEGGVITVNGEVNPVPGPSGALLAAIGSGLLGLSRLRRLRLAA